MRFRECTLIFLLLLGICAVFFYKTFLYGYIPFPGDLLINEYNPWRTYSYLGYNPGSFPHKAQYFDVLRQMYPWRTLATDLLKTGQMPLWNPYNFSGAPLLANFQSAVFYPLHVIYLWLPQTVAWAMSTFLQPFLIALFTYLYARKIGVSLIGGLFAALSFAFSSFMVVWVEYNTIGHVILWLPLILLAIEHLREKVSTLWSAIFIFALSASIFAGHIQLFAYLLLFVIVYTIWRFKRFRRLTFVGSLLALALGIGAVQLLPGIELVKESARVAYTYDFLIHKILIQPWQLVMFFVPDFFGNPSTHNYWPSDTYIGKMTSIGIVPLFFILLTLKKTKVPFVRFFVLGSVIVFTAITFNPIALLFYAIPLPIVSASAPTLSAYLLAFFLSLLAGFGVDVWKKYAGSLKELAKLFVTLLAVFLLLWVGVFYMYFSHSLSLYAGIAFRNLLYGTVIAVLAAAFFILGIGVKRTRYGLLILLLLLHIATLWRSFDKFNPFVPEQFVFPNAPILTFLKETAGIDRFWGYGSAFIEANTETQYSLFSPNGYDPLYPKRYGEFIHASKNGKILEQFTTSSRSDAVVAPGYGEDDLSLNTYRLRVLDTLGVRYILDRAENASTEKTFPQERFSLVYQKDGWKIFENKKASPRAFLTTDYKMFSTKEEFENIFFSQNFDPSKTILLEQKIPGILSGENSLSTIKLRSYAPNTVVYDVQTDGNKMLFLSDTYYPGWKAFVDGKETKLYRANYAFRAVYVPKGDHTVMFSFSPSMVYIGKWISFGSIFASLSLFLVLHQSRYRLL